MLHSSYNRAPRRKLIPNLFSNILQVIADADHPLTEPEIVEAVSDRLDRSDEELKRQITVSLHDALIYGYLRVKNYRYSIVPSRLDPDDHHHHPGSLSIGQNHNQQSTSNNHQEGLMSRSAEQAIKRETAEPEKPIN
ncbi:uncharacterized protein LOC128260366 [Drosophila gunungcola]|uniref:DUF4777 domain-containing protein n=1 Tax=Drosophila gunungcola TaxID=103775 RepID=A0A9Q0BKU3_9MUSC|nr:uncharacterized protein LOC128260366 [Drosophila gunungcola]KAI8036182.1 hypothetical protein M5D96_011042 [Drosophila gunungcola]